MNRLFSVLRDLHAARRLRRYSCKLSGGISRLGRDSELRIESHVSIGVGIIKSGQLEIGAHSYLRSGCELYEVSSIGRFCSIANHVIIGLNRNEHPINWLGTSLYSAELMQQYQRANSPEKSAVRIGHDSWIGRDACIMDGVNICNGAIVAARSVVTSDVPPYAIVAGAPARILRYRFPPELIAQLEVMRWWDFPETTLAKLDFSDPLACLHQLENESATVPAHYPRLSLTRHGVSIID